MLQFWKRSGQKNTIRSSSATDITTEHLADDGITLNHFEQTGLLASFDDDGSFDTGNLDISHSSRLSKTLSEVLHDKSALGYFIQFLDTNGSLSYIRCWLDIECFRSAAQIPDTCTSNVITRDQLEENIRIVSSPNSQSQSVSSDCNVNTTTNSNSSCDFSTSAIDESKTSERSFDRDISNISYNVPKLGTTTHTSPLFDNNHRNDKYTKRSNELSEADLKIISHKSNNVAMKPTDQLSAKGDFITNNFNNLNHDLNDATVQKSIKHDSVRLFKKYIAQEALQPISCPDDLRNDVIESICTETGILNPFLFDKIQKYVFDILDQRFFNLYLRSHYHCKYQIDILTSGNITLSDILYNESILFYFMEFLEQENCSCLLAFWLAATNFQEHLLTNENYNFEEAQSDAVVLYDKYFSLQATCPLGFGDKIRLLIEENICRENGPLFNCFNKPRRLIECALNQKYLQAFLRSQLYFKYLSELISTVQTNNFSTRSTHTRTNSDCSSEISNTLLAMDESSLPKSKHNHKSDMNIDSRQLYDPDLLWRRRKRMKTLSFGRITNLGRFETDVEPEPDKRTESRLTRAMKKLVHLDENKTKEELAWQVAEMIVKDITSITLADNAMQS